MQKYVRTGARVCALLALAATTATTAQARGGDWELIGQRDVPRGFSDITLPVGAEMGRFTELRFESEDGTVVIRDLDVRLRRGGTADLVDDRFRMRDGRTTRFELPGRRPRIIEEIEVRARARRGRDARLTVYGLSAESRRGADEWEVLETAAYDARTRAVDFRIGREEGAFQSIQIRALDRPVRIRGLDIRYENGRFQSEDYETLLRPGETLEPINLRGRNARFIRSVSIGIETGRRDTAGRLQVLGSDKAYRPKPDFKLVSDRFVDTRARRIRLPLDGDRDYEYFRLRPVDDDLNIRGVIVNVAGADNVSFDRARAVKRGELSEIYEIPAGRGNARMVTLLLEPGSKRDVMRVELLAAERFDEDRYWADRDRRGRDRGDRFSRYDDRRDARGREPERDFDRGRGVSRTRVGEPPQLNRRGAPVDYIRFGSQTVAKRGERDVFDIGRDFGRFDRIAFRVLNAPVRLDSITIVYGNGAREELDINSEIRANTVTSSILLDGDRFIDRIELVHGREGRGREAARVELYGLYADSWLKRQRQSDADSWLLLGAKRAEMFSQDADGFPVGKRYGRFDQIRVRARRNDVRLYGMTITYGNGTTEEVDLFGKLDADTYSKAIDLKGRDRFIEKVELRYRSTFSLRGEGVVEVWGHRGGGRRPQRRGDVRMEDRVKDGLKRALGDLFKN